MEVQTGRHLNSADRGSTRLSHAWQSFNHGRSRQDEGRRHPSDHRDFGFVPARSLLGLVPMLVGWIGLLELYPSSHFYSTGWLWSNPIVVAVLTAIASIFMFATPLIGMPGPDGGWGDHPPRINYSLSHMIDNRLLTCCMSTLWVYPSTLLWATEYRTDWLQSKDIPGGLIEFLYHAGTFAPLWRGSWVQVVRRTSLFVWNVAFIGFLCITDSTKFVAHTVAVNVFAFALVVHVSTIILASSLGDHKIGAQCFLLVSAALGLIAFFAFNMHSCVPCVKRGVAYWYWFAEVWALSNVLWFTPARIFFDENSPSLVFCLVFILGICISFMLGVVPLLPKSVRATLPSYIRIQ